MKELYALVNNLGVLMPVLNVIFLVTILYIYKSIISSNNVYNERESVKFIAMIIVMISSLITITLQYLALTTYYDYKTVQIDKVKETSDITYVIAENKEYPIKINKYDLNKGGTLELAQQANGNWVIKSYTKNE